MIVTFQNFSKHIVTVESCTKKVETDIFYENKKLLWKEYLRRNVNWYYIHEKLILECYLLKCISNEKRSKKKHLYKSLLYGFYFSLHSKLYY